MIVGVPRETAAQERRVALTPADVARLRGSDVRVRVQQGAGWRADFTDRAYVEAGATLVAHRREVFADADVIAWVKPPVYDLDAMPLHPGQSLLGFQDPVHREARIRSLEARGVHSVAFERISAEHTAAQPDPLSAMSMIAGDVAYRTGRALLPARVQARPIRTLVIGCGRAGLAAIAAAVQCGDERPTAIGIRAEQRESAIACGAAHFLMSPTPRAIVGHLTADDPELIICAAGHRGNQAPILLDDSALNALTAGTVVVDLTAKAGGNCIATVANSTVRLPTGITIAHRSNYPADRPHAASRAYGAATATEILRLAQDLNQPASPAPHR
ncbi:hypothetical protein OHB26_04440 [Nocardia sp. NBC_01503]|uniref:hypothetical protein n=1 Tax=Nocardia sp. NBC_01503 TaxID=2975997 RepID=UPI002E7B2033|nr:hypothetical protein [Nocardia sp. NBC_01503]WTL33496.1 hypothetical protein OHB26_04440 [Nocardia sp. NBC_01503]